MTHRVADRLLMQAVALLALYTLAALLTSLKFLGPDALTQTFPYQQASALTNLLLHLGVVSGLLGGGVKIASVAARHESPRQARWLVWAGHLWTALLILSVLTGLLGLLESRVGLELPLPLAALQVAVLFAVTAGVTTWPGISWTPPLTIWSVSMVLLAASALIGLLPTAHYMQDQALRSIAVNTTVHSAHLLGGVALLGARLRQQHASGRLFILCGLLALGGGLVSLPPLTVIGASDWAAALGTVSAILIPLLYAAFVGLLGPLTASLDSSQRIWVWLGLLLAFLGPGLLGGLQASPDILRWTVGTHLTAAQRQFGLLSAAALILSTLVAYSPGALFRAFWPVAFGALGSGIALVAAGLVQVYLERVLGTGYLETQTLLIPIYALWAGCALILTLGVGLFALILWRASGETSLTL